MKIFNFMTLLSLTYLSAQVIDGYTIVPFGNESESTCGNTIDWQDVESYDGSLGPSKSYVLKTEKPVGRLILPIDNSNKAYQCTGTIIAKGNFLTAGHCYDDSKVNPKNSFVQFNYQKDTNGNTRTPIRYNVKQLLEHRKGNLDYAIISFKNNPTKKYSPRLITEKLPKINDELTIIQHPNGIPKVIEAGNYSGLNGNYISYIDLDTSGGSSGSGVLNSAEKLIAVHTNGGCNSSGGANKGVSILKIQNILI